MSRLELPTISVTLPGSTTQRKSAFRMAKSELEVVPSGNPLKYAEGIKRFYHMSEVDRKQYSENAVKTVHLFDTEVLNAEWDEIISNQLNRR